jgi:putative hydrolase of the HAD superfamily
MPVSAVFLDVGGVFHLPNPEQIRQAIGVAVDDELLARAHYAATATLAEFVDDDREIWNRYIHGYAMAIGHPEREHALVDAFNRRGMWSHVIPGSVDGLRRLAGTGVRLAIVSNSDGTLEERLMAAMVCQVGAGAAVCVAAVLDSGVCGFAKPDPRIFELALAATGVPADETVHVGDTVGADVAGARAAGVRPLHLDPYGFCSDATHEHVASLDDVVEVICSAGA